MQILNSKKHLQKIFFRLLFLKPYHLPLQIKQLSPRTIFQNHDVVFIRIDELSHVYKKRKRYVLIYLSLVLDQIIFIFYLLFLDEFSSKKCTIWSVTSQIYLAKTTHSYTLQNTVSLHPHQHFITFSSHHTSYLAIASDPSRTTLYFIVSKQILIGSLKVSDFIIIFLTLIEKHLFEGICRTGHGNLKNRCFSLQKQRDGDSIWVGLIFMFGTTPFH